MGKKAALNYTRLKTNSFSCVFSCEEHNMSSISISPYLTFSPMESSYFGIAICTRSDPEVGQAQPVLIGQKAKCVLLIKMIMKIRLGGLGLILRPRFPHPLIYCHSAEAKSC